MGLHCSHKALETRHSTPQEPIYWQFTGKTVTSRQLDETTTESRDVLSPAESTHRMKKLVCFGSLFKVTATPASLFIVLCLPWHKSCQKIDICLVSKSIQANMSPPAEWQPVSIKPWCPSTSLYPAYFKKQAEFLSLERSAAGTTPPMRLHCSRMGCFFKMACLQFSQEPTQGNHWLFFLCFLTTALQNGRIREDRFEEWRGGSEVQPPHAS